MPRSGRMSVYWRSTSCSRGSVQASPSLVRYPSRTSSLVTQSSSREQSMGSSPSRVSTESQRSSTSLVMSSTSAPKRSSVYLRARSRYSSWSWIAVIRRPSRSVTRCRQVGSCEIGAEEAVLDHREHQRRRAQLQVAGDLAHIRVADGHVQAAVLLRVGVRLVPGVDDRPLQRGLEADLDLEEIGA